MSIKLFHRYIGLVLCIAMLPISISGVVLVWKKEYLCLTVEDACEAVDVSLLDKAIDVIEENYNRDEVLFIQLHSEDLSLHKVYLRNGHYAWHNQHGEKIQQWSGNQRLEDLFLDIHRRLLLGNFIGLNMVGIGSLLLLLLIVLGLIIWWPKRSFFRVNSLVPNIWLTIFSRRQLLQRHGDVGSVLALPVFVFGVTGVILIYPIESRTILLDGFGKRAPEVIRIESFDASDGLPVWSEIIEIARHKFPESRIRSVQPSSTNSFKRIVNLQQKTGWHRLGRTSLSFSIKGELLIKDELAQARAERVMGFTYPLHTAKLGLFYRVIVTVLGLGFIFLSVLGLIAYLQRPPKNSSI